VIEGGFWRWLLSWVGGDRYKVDAGTLKDKITESSNKVKQQASDKLEAIFQRINKEEKFKLKKSLNEAIERNKKQTLNYLNAVYEPIRKVDANLTREKKEKEALVQFFNEFNQKWEIFARYWKEAIIKDYVALK